MKKLILIFALFAIVNGCNDSGNAGEKSSTDAVDSTGLISPTDSINPPGGIINGSPISTDTAATNMQNALDKKDSIDNK